MEKHKIWPGREMLLLCAMILTCGYGAAFFRGSAKGEDVRVKVFTESAAEKDALETK